MRRGTILALSLVALMLSSSLAIAQDTPVDGAPDTNPGEDIDYTRESIVITQDLEKGKIKMKLGEAEMFVHFGDGEIEFATIQTKYMGVADVYDQRRGFDERIGIPVETIFWQRLVGIVEYTDANDNGLFDINGANLAGTLDELDDVTHEEMQKWVGYDAVEWSLTEWHQTRNGNEVNINFVISASDVPYESDDGPITSATVGRLAYIFHVTTVEEEIQISAVPHYRITVNEEGATGDQIDESELIARSNVNGLVLNSTWKYDQVIEGWDVATDNVGVERNDTRLAVLTEMAYGVHMDSAVGEWIREEFGGLPAPRAIAGHAPRHQPSGPAPDVASQERADDQPSSSEAADVAEHDREGNPLRCGLAYVDADGVIGSGSGETEGRSATSGSQATNDSDSSGSAEKSDEEKKQEKVKERVREYTQTACIQRGAELATDGEARPEVVRAGAIHFQDNGANLGRVRWVSNATVDGLETEVLFQLHGARPIIPEDVGDNDGIWAGVRLVGGYNYVIGNNVYHDPEFSADIMTMDTQSFGSPAVFNGGLFGLVKILPLLIGVVVLGVIGVAVVSARDRRDTAPLPQQQQYAPAGAWTSGDDWEQYQ